MGCDEGSGARCVQGDTRSLQRSRQQLNLSAAVAKSRQGFLRLLSIHLGGGGIGVVDDRGSGKERDGHRAPGQPNTSDLESECVRDAACCNA